MRNAAAAAAMSDPERNRWFRRRWAELPVAVAARESADVGPTDDGLALTGLALLQEWRKQRGSSVTVRR